MNRTSSSRRRNLLYGAACLLLVAAYVGHSLTVNYVIDDSFITFRYVNNFIHGNGPVYNPGERVEGYTHFLWVALLAGGQRLLPAVDLFPIARALGILFGALAIVLVCRFSSVVYAGPTGWGLLAGAFLATHAGLAAWGGAGLDTTIFAFLITAGAFAYVRYLKLNSGFPASPLVFALAAMVRPDALLFFGITSLFALLYECRTKGVTTGIKRMLVWSAAFLSLWAPYFVWRYEYYGYLFPNVYYAKVGTGTDQYLRGLRYVLDYAGTYGGILLAPLLLFLLFVPRRAAWRDYLFVLVGAYGLYIVYVGGDGLGFSRFVVHIVPLLYLLVQDSLVELHTWLSNRFTFRRVVWAVVTIPAIVLVLVLNTRQASLTLLFPEQHRWYEPQSQLSFPGLGRDHSYVWFDNYFVDRLRIAAEWLEVNAPRNSVVAATPAGSIAYYMHLPVIDMLGLNDEHIAHVNVANTGRGRAGHEKGDGRYVLSRRPEFILLGNVAVLPQPLTEAEMAGRLVLKSEHEIWNDPGFHRDYELVSVHLADRGVFRYFTFYKRRDVFLPTVPDARTYTSNAGSKSWMRLDFH